MSCSMLINNGGGSLVMNGGGPTSRPCQLILQQCLAITLRKPGANGQLNSDAGEFWMYDSGYLLFQSFLSTNSKCWWNKGLVTACKQLRYCGYVQQGILLIGSKDACALELIRAAFARGVLKPPEGHIIYSLGDIEDCIITPCVQGQFTPLPEALCDVILELTTNGNDAVLESIRKSLSERFSNIQTPNHETIYDTLAQLVAERKIYQTAKGYFIVTPERRRSRSHSNGRCASNSSRSTPTHHHTITNSCGSYLVDDTTIGGNGIIDETEVIETRRRMLLSEDELLVIAHGDMATLRDGHVTHQCVQTSLRDVICGGSPSDKILYPRSAKRRSASFPVAPRNGASPDRRRSTSTGRGTVGGTALRLWGSARRLRRSASTRSLARDKHHNATMTSTDSSSGTESNGSPKKASLLSRLFRRSTKRNQPLGTFSGQFPPPEWFNSTAIHLHSIGTQTNVGDMQQAQQEYNCNKSETTETVELQASARSATLPRSHMARHRRHLSNESNALTISYANSRDQSPNLRRLSPVLVRNYNTNSLPRHKGGHKSTKTGGITETIQNRHLSSKTSIDSSANSRFQSSTSELKSITDSPTNNDRLTKSMIDSRNRSLRKNADCRNNSEYRSMRETNLDRRTRYNVIEHRSVRNDNMSNKSTLERRSNSKTIQRTTIEPKLNGSSAVSSDSGLVNESNIVSGPSSLESHRTDPTSGPSSLESQKTVISTSITDTGKKMIKKDISNSNKLMKSDKMNVTKSNSFTLQVTTNQNGVSVANYTGTSGRELHDDCDNDDNSATTTATINGTNTKIFVQNSPIRSVITFENGGANTNLQAKDYLIINNETNSSNDSRSKHIEINDKIVKNVNEATINNVKTPILNNSNVALNDYDNTLTMNNRKLSLQMPSTKDSSLNYKNVLKNMSTADSNSIPSSPVINFRDFTKNSFSSGGGSSHPSSPTKSFDSFNESPLTSIYYDKNSPLDKKLPALRHSLTNTAAAYQLDNCDVMLLSSLNKIAADKNTLGSEPNLCLDKLDREKTLTPRDVDLQCNFPSLSDLSFNFTSLAAQKILKGCSINSVDTLVELNMAANNTNEKQNNCDV